MATTAEDPCRTELTNYVSYLHHYCEDWYTRSVQKLYLTYYSLMFLAAGLSVAASLLAALTDLTESTPLVKGLLVTLPILSTVLTGLVGQWKLHDWWKLREEGRIAFQDLVSEGRRLLAAAKSEEQCVEVHELLQTKAFRIEWDQKNRFFSLPQPESRRRRPPDQGALPPGSGEN